MAGFGMAAAAVVLCILHKTLVAKGKVRPMPSRVVSRSVWVGGLTTGCVVLAGVLVLAAGLVFALFNLLTHPAR